MHRCRLLVLDDDPMIGLTIQLIAESAGAAARLSTDPDDFFAVVEAWNPTHLCVDLNMPAMDGLQVLTELAQRGNRAQVIVNSGVGQRVLEAAARSGSEQGLNVAGVLAKPFTAAALRELLSRHEPPVSVPADLCAPPPSARDHVPDLAELEAALQRGELTAVYQPKVRCADGRLGGFEALVRWWHPQHGEIGPDRFIAMAERAGHIDELTMQVLDQALAWFVPWCADEPGREAVTLSVNLSARSLGSMDFCARLHDRCVAAGMNPSQLIFELTETAAMDDPALALALLTRLRVQGFQLSIDDFGTGYSSMLQLVRLPFSEIKVDRSFVMTCARSPESRTVVRSIVDLGRSLGLRVTAEGVEDAGTLAYLRDLGCDDAQGFLIARPLAAAQVDGWLRAREAAAA